jgi:excisionase family DNA binding protein
MNKQEAAEFLEVSTRAVERYTTKGQLHPAYKQGKFGAEAVYDRKELEAFKAEREQPADKPTPAPMVMARRPPQDEDMQAMARAFARAFYEETPTLVFPGGLPSGGVVSEVDGGLLLPSEIDKLMFLSLRQAASLSGLSAGVLRQAIKDKKLKARRDLGRGFKIKRGDLDVFVKKL